MDASVQQRLSSQFVGDAPLTKEAVGQVVGLLKQQLSDGFKHLDDRMRSVQHAMVADAKQLRLKLPVEGA